MITGINAGTMSAMDYARAGMQQASDNVSHAAFDIARSGKTSGASLTQNLVGLEVNTTYHQASANVLRVSDNTVGYLLDTMA